MQTLWERVNAQIGKPPRNLRVAGTVHSRLGSERVPNKGILPLAGYPAWWHCMQRVEAAADLAGIELVSRVLATSGKTENDILAEQAEQYGYDCVRYDPEYDVWGRWLAVMDKYDCDVVLAIGADTPLGFYEHVPAHWEVHKLYNCPADWSWRDNKVGNNPQWGVNKVIGQIVFRWRWQCEMWRHLASTPADYEAMFISWLNPEIDHMLRHPRDAIVETPQWYWDYARDYVLELDNWEDAVMMMLLYDLLWEGPGTVIDWRKCIEYIDAHPEHHYSLKREHSTVNAHAENERIKRNYANYLNYCDRHLCPEDGTRMYCWSCGEYLGYYVMRDGVKEVHRPDTTPLEKNDRLACSHFHFGLWPGTVDHCIIGGSAVTTPPQMEWRM